MKFVMFSILLSFSLSAVGQEQAETSEDLTPEYYHVNQSGYLSIAEKLHPPDDSIGSGFFTPLVPHYYDEEDYYEGDYDRKNRRDCSAYFGDTFVKYGDPSDENTLVAKGVTGDCIDEIVYLPKEKANQGLLIVNGFKTGDSVYYIGEQSAVQTWSRTIERIGDIDRPIRRYPDRGDIDRPIRRYPDRGEIERHSRRYPDRGEIERHSRKCPIDTKPIEHSCWEVVTLQDGEYDSEVCVMSHGSRLIIKTFSDDLALDFAEIADDTAGTIDGLLFDELRNEPPFCAEKPAHYYSNIVVNLELLSHEPLVDYTASTDFVAIWREQRKQLMEQERKETCFYIELWEQLLKCNQDDLSMSEGCLAIYDQMMGLHNQFFYTDRKSPYEEEEPLSNEEEPLLNKSITWRLFQIATGACLLNPFCVIHNAQPIKEEYCSSEATSDTEETSDTKPQPSREQSAPLK